VSPTEVLPLLVVAVLLLSASGAEPETMEVVFDGDHDLADAGSDAVVVGGGTVTVPANASATGPVYVVGGTLLVDGRIRGDVTVLAGNLSVADGGSVTGRVRAVGGNASVADGARVGARTGVEFATGDRSPATQLGFLAMQVLALGGLSALVARRNPTLLRNVGHSVTSHSLVSGVVGALAGLTLLVLFVYMAFTLVLLPVSVAGLLAEFFAVLYGYAAYGYLVGQRLPVDRVDLASGLGTGVFVVANEALGRVPLLGDLVQLVLLVVGFGAVLVTYFGLREFQPAEIPG